MGDLLAPQDRVKQNQQLVAAVGAVVKANYVVRVQGREYLTVAGAQAIASGMGLSTTTEQLRHVPATEGLPGYWEATATVLDGSGIVVGRGVGCVFDDESPWNKRPQFARQMMAQTRATGRALKGVVGWAFALLGTQASLHEEMPEEAATAPQDGLEGVRRLPAAPKAPEASKGKGGRKEGFQEVRGTCSGVESKVSKAGKAYWRIALDSEDGTTWFTSFKEVPDVTGKALTLSLEPWKDGFVVADFWEVAAPGKAGEEIPF